MTDVEAHFSAFAIAPSRAILGETMIGHYDRESARRRLPSARTRGLRQGLLARTPALAPLPLADEVQMGAGRVVPSDPTLRSEGLTEVLGSHPLPWPPEPQGRQSAPSTLSVY